MRKGRLCYWATLKAPLPPACCHTLPQAVVNAASSGATHARLPRSHRGGGGSAKGLITLLVLAHLVIVAYWGECAPVAELRVKRCRCTKVGKWSVRGMPRAADVRCAS